MFWKNESKKRSNFTFNDLGLDSSCFHASFFCLPSSFISLPIQNTLMFHTENQRAINGSSCHCLIWESLLCLWFVTSFELRSVLHLYILLLFSTLLYHEPLRGRWRHWTGKTIQWYGSSCDWLFLWLRGKAWEILGLKLFVSNVKISIILTSWKAWKAIFCLEN